MNPPPTESFYVDVNTKIEVSSPNLVPMTSDLQEALLTGPHVPHSSDETKLEDLNDQIFSSNVSSADSTGTDPSAPSEINPSFAVELGDSPSTKSTNREPADSQQVEYSQVNDAAEPVDQLADQGVDQAEDQTVRPDQAAERESQQTEPPGHEQTPDLPQVSNVDADPDIVSVLSKDNDVLKLELAESKANFVDCSRKASNLGGQIEAQNDAYHVLEKRLEASGRDFEGR